MLAAKSPAAAAMIAAIALLTEPPASRIDAIRRPFECIAVAVAVAILD
jgi:hypothetical protein